MILQGSLTKPIPSAIDQRRDIAQMDPQGMSNVTLKLH